MKHRKRFALFALLFVMTATVAKADNVKFKKLSVKIGNEYIMAEIADTDAKRERGLMFRKELPDGEGMLFIFDESTVRSFWMKNTLIPLSIGYFDGAKVLIDIQNMEPASSIDTHPKIYTSKGPAKYALEVPLNWFAKHHVPLKSKMEITRP